MEAAEEMEDCEGMFSDDDDDGSQTDEEESEGTEGSSDGDDDDGDDDDDDAGGDDSEEEGDEEDGEGEAWETDEEDEDGLLEASDSDTEGDNCPICLNRFRDQDIGNPEACDHSFCLECIQEWAKNVNTCPVDRQVFHLILCRHSGEEKIFRRIPVEDRNKQAEEVEEDPTYCEVCNQCDREDRLLLCDGCDLGYHLDCLTPPLKRVPVDEWFCPECGDDLAEEVDDSEEMDEIIAENDAYIPRRNRRQPRRQIARTRVAERVRSAIEEIRVNRTRTIRRILSSSEDEDEEDSPPTNAASSSTSSTKKSSPKKRKAAIRKTPRIYPKKKGTKRKTGKRKTVKRRKTTKKRRKTTRKGGRRKKRVKRARTARPVPVTTVKSRIAGALGLSTPPVGRTIPMQKLKQEKSLDMKKQDIGAVGLSIFGAREELMHFSDEDGTSMPNSVPRASRYSRSALSSYKPIGRVPIIPAKKAPKNFVVEAAPATSGGPLDLLGSIMMDQDKLIMGSRDITIQKDGSLATKGKETLKTLVKKATDKVIPPTGSASDTCLFKSTFSSIRSTSPSKSQHHNSSSPTKSTPVNIFENSVSPTKFSKKSQIQIQISPKKNVVTDKDSTTSSSLETSKSLGFKPSILSEAYDPAHPTDELEEGSVYTPILENPENMNPVSEDEYDPAHPTEDIEYDFDSSGNEEENGNDNDEKSVSDDEKDTNEDLSNISSDENSVVNKDDGEYDDISDESLDNDAEAQQDNSVNDMDIEYTEDADSIKVKEYVDPAVEGANCDDGSSEIGAEKHRAANNMNVPSDVGITESSEEQVSSVIAKGSENNSDHKYSDKESKLNNSANVAEKVETIKPVVPSRPGFHSGLPQVTGYKRSIPTALSQKDKGVDKLNSTGEKFPMKPPALKSLFEKPTNPVSQNSNPGGSKNTSATNKGNPTSKNPGNPHSKDNEKKSPTKKLLPTLKPFEITRKTQVEKRRLYGGEIDFTEDVTFSEGEFPDFDYSIKIKTIEEVFKDTKKKEVKKITKKIEPVPDEKLGEKFTPIDTEAREIQETVHADIDKIDLAKADTISVENIEPVVDSVENSQNVDTADSHSNNNEPLEDSDESNKFKLAMEHMKSTLSDKIQLVVDGAKSGKNKASKSDGIDSTKSTLSDRFKSVSEKNSSKKEIVSDKFRSISDVHEESFKSLEEEDPIHEMRRLDKQLEKELGNPDLVKKKSRSDKEYKHEKEKSKSKRKVSIDRDDVESSWRETKESRRMEAEYRSKTWEEIEEGEVEVEEIRYKEKKKKDRHKEKRKKADKEEKYYEYDDREDGEIQYVDPNKGKSDADLDTRIVIQVSQHNEDRQVWEEDEKLKKKMKKEREREERRKERERSRERESRREKKRKRRSRSRERHRSRERRRSRSRREREKSRSRSRDRSLERARRKKRRDRERDRSRSKSRDRSLERSRKKKRRNRDRSRDRSSSREQSVEKIDIFGRDIGLWSGRDKEKHSKREKSSEKSDIFGTATSRHSESPRRSKSKESEEDTHAPSSQSPVNHLKHEETSEFQITVPSKKQHGAGKKSSVSSKQTRVAKLKAEEVSRIEVKDYGHPGTKYSGSEAEERDDDYDDEPEETEQFSYTDRDDYLGQNRHKQQQENMIDVLKVRGEYDPAEPTEPSSPQPPQPPTPPLPLMAEQPFIRGPFPPPGPPPLHPPPPGPPPGIMQPPLPITIRESPPPSMLMGQERPPLPLCPDRPLIPMSQEGPPLPIPTCEPPGPGILGDRVLMHRPPPPREPPPGMMQSPNRLPMGMNVLPPAFPRGMSPQNHQRPMIIPPLMEQRPRLNMPRLGWQEVPFRGPAPPLVNGPFERLPLLSEEPRGSPLCPPFPPHPVQMNEPPRHLVQIRPDCPPPSNLVQIPRDEHPIVPPGPGPPPFPSPSPPARHLIQLPPHRGDARLPIPLLPTSEAPPHSVFLSMPPPTTVITSMVGRSPTPPGDAAMSGPPPFRPLLEQEFEAYPRTPSPHTPVMSVLPNLQNNIPVSPPIDSQAIPGLGDLNSIPTVTEVINSAMNGKSVSPDFEDKDRKSPVPALSQLEQITKLLTTQAKLIQEQDKNDSATKNDIHNKHLSDDKLFKVPLPPGSKSVFGIKAETTEVVDMDVSSPNDDEGTIELPLSPEFDNFIDFDLQEMFNKKTSEKKNDREKKLSKVTKTPEKSNVDTSALNDAALKKNEIDISIISKLLDTSIKNLKMKEEDEALKKEVESACKKTIVTSPLVKTEPDDSKAHVDIVTKVFGVSIPKENITITKTKDVKMKLKENKPHHHQKTKSHKRKEKDKSHHKEKDMSLKALRDAQLDLESQDMPSSAVDMENQEKYLKKLHLQERVVEEVKMAIKPHYANKDVTKDQYKDILRRAVPKICHSKSGDINPSKIKSLVEAYVGKFNKIQEHKDLKHSISPGLNNQISPGVKANGERVKSKAKR